MVKIINQDKLDKLLFECSGYGPYEEYIDDCKAIQNVIKQEFNIFISIRECADFWNWRSNEWDASWLTLNINEKSGIKEEIKEFFIEYLKYLEG